LNLLSFLTGRLADHLGDLVPVFGLIVILGLFEHLRPVEPHQSLRGRVRNLTFTAVSQLGGGILVSLCAYLALPYFLLPTDPIVRRNGLEQLGLILGYIFVSDLAFYWYHRAQHAFPAFWRIHELHHSDEELNATSSLRRYLLERPLQFAIVSLPIASVASRVPALQPLQLQQEDAGRLFLISLSWLTFAHANLRLELGRFSWIATGPQVHRIHHSILPEHHGKNFAQFFPVIDVMFGTYQPPRPGEFPPTGTAEMSGQVSVVHSLLKPLRSWAHPWKGRAT
jgi:sterol desaturase/sphingolipid hydroxylase (fatty acid hydroxylase superfamily)